MKKKEVNQKQLSQILGINASSVNAATTKGKLHREPGGLYDLNNAINKDYLKSKGIDGKKIIIPKPANAGRPLPGKKAPGKIISAVSEKTSAELNRKNIELKNERIQQQLDFYNKTTLPTEFIERVYITYIERLNSAIERISATGIKDVGALILEDQEVKPCHIEKFNNMVLEAIYNNKEAVRKEVHTWQPDKKNK